MEVFLDRRRASEHARYAPCAAIGMEARDDGTHCIRFEVIDGREPVEIMLEALDALEARVDRALFILDNQPVEPPKSMC